MKAHTNETNSKLMGRLFESCPVVPVLTISTLDEALPLASAIVMGGIRVLEVTLRTSCAFDAISLIREEIPDAIVGGGTVTSVSHLERLKEAGAHFAVSPGLTVELLRRAKELGIPYLPGVSSVSEMMIGLNEGYDFFKFFPAAAVGGVPALKSFQGPFSDVRFCPTGGINEENFRSYLDLPNTLCVGGSWLAPKDLIKSRDWNKIASMSKSLTESLLL